MSDALRRGLRTALQLVVTLLGNGALFGLLVVLEVPVTLEQFGAVSAVLLPIVTAGLNALEDRGTIPAVLKAPASPGAHPVPEVTLQDEGAATAEVGTEDTGRAEPGEDYPGSARM